MIYIKELKARKAKYGFDFGCITLRNIVMYGLFIQALQVRFANDKYIAEETGYRLPELKIYTDDDQVAEWIRNYP